MSYLYNNISSTGMAAARSRSRATETPSPVWLVTGGEGGIGRAIVRVAAASGARVVSVDIRSVDRSEEPLSSLLRLVHDVTTPADPVFRALDDRFGRLDVLVNAAGGVGQGTAESTPMDEWRRLLELNLTSAFAFSRLAVPRLRASRGCIVNVSSTNGLTGGSPLSGPAYAAAKAGLVALTRNMARDLGPDGVRVNCVAPGPVDTPMLHRLSPDARESLRRSIPLGALGSPEDVAAVVRFLASPEARHLTGATLALSGGLVMH